MSSRPNTAITKTYRLWTTLPPQEVFVLLSQGLQGSVTENVFEGRLSESQNKWMPSLMGTYAPASGGTYIEFHLRVRSVILLVGIPLFFLLGTGLVAIPLAIIAYLLWKENDLLQTWLRHTLNISLRNGSAAQKAQNEEIADPTSDGAEANAPRGFKAKHTFDSTTFQLRNRRNKSTYVSISQQGIRIKKGDSTQQLGWLELATITSTDTFLVFEFTDERHALMADAADVSAEDILWLAVYLDSRRQRWSPALEAHRDAGEKLAKLKESRQTE